MFCLNLLSVQIIIINYAVWDIATRVHIDNDMA